MTMIASSSHAHTNHSSTIQVNSNGYECTDGKIHPGPIGGGIILVLITVLIVTFFYKLFKAFN
jgi:hypothetical protein